MKKTILSTILFFALASFLFTSCLKKEESRPAPTIEFKTGGNYVSGNDTVLAGGSTLVGFKCKSNGKDQLYAFTAYVNGYVALSTAVPTISAYEFNIDTLILFKSDEPTQNWIFQITDYHGMSSSIGFTTTMDETGGPIEEYYANIAAPNSSPYSGYYSLNTKSSYIADSAQNHQPLIDFLAAYDATNLSNLVSPDGGNLPEPYLTEMADWSTLNSTKFCTTKLTVFQFDNINRDFLIISSFDTDPVNQKSKAKNLKDNDIYSFKLNDGRYGLFRVTDVTVGPSGKIFLHIKVQPKTK